MAIPDSESATTTFGLFGDLLKWGRDHGVGFWQTLITAGGLVILRVTSRFVSQAKNVVGSVHDVYDKLLSDQKNANAELRQQLDDERQLRKRVSDELAADRLELQLALRYLARARERLANMGESPSLEEP